MKPLGRMRLKWLNHQVDLEKSLGRLTLPVFAMFWVMIGVLAYMYGWRALTHDPTMIPLFLVVTFWGLERSWWARYVEQLRAGQTAEGSQEPATDSGR